MANFTPKPTLNPQILSPTFTAAPIIHHLFLKVSSLAKTSESLETPYKKIHIIKP